VSGLATIARAYRDPRSAMAIRREAGLSEPRVLAELMAACGLLFLASLPAAVRSAALLGIEDAVPAAVAAHLFGYLCLLPLIGYGLAALLHLAARALGGRGDWLGARAALFRSGLLAAPVAGGLALAGAVAGGQRLPWVTWLSYAGLAFWLWLLAASLAEAEGFAATGRVVAVLGAGAAGIAAAVALATGGGAAG
jgi:hypothetical protein